MADKSIMKTSWIKGTVLVVLLTFAVGFKADDIIELKQYLNGRGGPNFLASTDNVEFVVPKGTRAKISEVKNFNSGNSGFKVEILTGSKAGESVWVYYNKNNPGMKLYEGESALDTDKPARDPASAKSIKTTRPHHVVKAAGEEGGKKIGKPVADDKFAPIAHGAEGGKEITKADFDALNKKIEKGQKATKQIGTQCDKCGADSAYFAGDVEGMDAPVLHQPQDKNTFGVRGAVSTDSGSTNFFQYTFVGDSAPGAYLISSRTFNKETGEISKTGREWNLRFEAQARQDMYMGVSNFDASGVTDSYYFMFPRKTLPHMREENGRLIATLPTGETVTYDATTKKVIKGVLRENSAADPSKIGYSGEGLIVRVDGGVGQNQGQGADPRRAEKATITKNGKSCQVPAKDLWPDQSKESALHFKYSSDDVFKQYVIKACGKDFNF
jgi:hypothetical protein